MNLKKRKCKALSGAGTAPRSRTGWGLTQFAEKDLWILVGNSWTRICCVHAEKRFSCTLGLY